jgi:hypothetical protein
MGGKKDKYTLKCNSAHCFIFTLKVDLTFMEENRLRVFENRALRKTVGLKRDEVTGTGEDCVMRCFLICTTHLTIFG